MTHELDTPVADADTEIGALTRRQIVKRGSALAVAATVPSALLSRSAFAAGAPVKIGFIALTDCASVVMAQELGLYKKHGVNVQLVKQASWPATRDGLLNGDIDAAHALFSLPISVACGIGGKAGTTALKIAMTLNNNGQAITLKNDLHGAGYGNLKAAKKALNGGHGKTLAMTFPGGTHDTWLRYWLMAMGIPQNAPKIIPIPPPQMVANMKVGTMDGYSVGEPWNAVAVKQKVGFTTIATQDIWKHHPEKALVVNDKLASRRTADLKKVMAAILEASKWLDVPANRAKAAGVIGTPAYVNAPPEQIKERLLGHYALGGGLGQKVFGDDSMKFFRGGQVNLPRKSHAIWFMAQYQRFGYLKSPPAYAKIANALVLSDLYKQVAKSVHVPVPNDDMKPFAIKLDGARFDPHNPNKEAKRR